MKALGYIILHYGKDYLEYSIKSVYNQLDEILILYTDNPSHGSGTRLQCPDTEQELYDIAVKNDPDNKINWFNGHWKRENDHRNYAHDWAKSKGFDILVTVDFDEVWKENDLRDLIKETHDRKASKCLIWMKHLWRSFNYICEDQMRQERIYYLGNDKKDLIYASQKENQVWHFGYARKPVDVEYKISIHGHKAEFKDSHWYYKKFLQYPFPNDVHPTCVETWTPKPFDKTQLPEIMRSHPYYDLEVIS